MLENENSVELNDENKEQQGENQDQNQDENNVQNDENQEGQDDNQEEGQENSDDVYAKKLAELEAENKKKEEMLNQKNGALKEERKNNKKLEERFDELEKKLADGKVSLTESELDELLTKREARNAELTEVLRMAKSDSEKNLIRGLIKTKGLSPKEAFALANLHIIESSRKEELGTIEDKKAMANFLGNNASGGNSKTISSLEKLASEGLTENERKKLNL